MTAELSPNDRQTLKNVEQEAATGHAADALKDLRAWRDSTDNIAKYRLAARELEQSGVLPVLGVAQLNDRVTRTKASVDESQIADRADSSDPIDRAIWGSASDNLKGAYHAPKSWGKTYEDADNLKALQAKIDRGLPALGMADALTANQNTLFNKFSKDGAISANTLNNYLMNEDGTKEDRDLARKLLNQLKSGNGEARELTPDERGGIITQASLNEYKILHPDAPADLTTPPDAKTTPPDAKTPPPDAKTPPPDAKTPPPDAKTPPPDAKTPPPDAKTPPPDAKTPPETKKYTINHDPWSTAFQAIMGHRFKRGQHWTNAQNEQILALTAQLEQHHKGKIFQNGDVIEIPVKPVPAQTN